ncbi:hypothetical protein [Armatimonas rosea]|uniref:Putative membrane protein n=1 Tax=Armatimonas rosea TaxID=685828 RepID=A0A7W9W6B8_ARMRO|nr:hypothetical protein [Armatimonas rosea]MBB6049412.1 putative membrane protein [Armatimonas rosea]
MNAPHNRLLHPPEPRWPAAVALVALGGLHMALPKELAVGPSWLLPTVVVLLLIPTIVTLRLNRHRLNRLFGFLSLGVVTGAELWSLSLLVLSLPKHTLTPGHLLKAAAALWITNVLVFALWYWRLDAGGPHQRETRDHHHGGAFLFPQLGMEGQEAWKPHFIDYLFLSFNHSTALSPTDTAILSRWAKGLIMLQASISLTTIALLAARAVNIL